MLVCAPRCTRLPSAASRATAGLAAPKVKFTATGPDGKTVALTVDLLNDAYDGARADVPDAIWKP
ncbi:hypothetical protein [Streptomyces atroolivaceus]|uniref:hypothetical protein n=1 Tax=Streptomyces atroolivaceus TaxID=66869 RepID=UPI0036B1B1D7